MYDTQNRLKVNGFAGDLNSIMNIRMDELAWDATMAAEEFMRQAYASREQRPRSWFRHAVRVRRGNSESGAVYIEWLKMEWKLTSKGRKYVGKHVKKGPTTRYPASRFSPVDSREANLIEYYEDYFELIREQVTLIGDIRRAMAPRLKRLSNWKWPELEPDIY
ncbi:conjugative transfer protein MobI(A/C) [Ectothiorhodospira variabilis]|uniref:conjugative transfer protein MobI(A/C) n=1 Tax=Ectothiorhodospira variabilis TaxID=505694 RepID=UPI001EFB412D|nr:conjugative transfer protein MobI(A/C) [Ectothiorhodospira variabilis]MCG5499145.1 hypothetical protein [Ectothiorhodospira variabilis]